MREKTIIRLSDLEKRTIELPTLKAPKGVTKTITEELAKHNITEYVWLSDFFQDTTSENSDFHWGGALAVCFSGKPKKDSYFRVVINIPNEAVAKGEFISSLLAESMKAIEVIVDYRDCVCSMEDECVYHATKIGSKTEIYKDLSSNL